MMLFVAKRRNKHTPIAPTLVNKLIDTLLATVINAASLDSSLSFLGDLIMNDPTRFPLNLLELE